MAAKVCLLTPQEAYNFETYQVTPDCRRHRHVSQREAEYLESDFGSGQRQDGKAVGHSIRRLKKSSDGLRRSAQESGRSWEKVTPDGLGYSRGMATMQMVRRRASYLGGPKRARTSGTHHGEVRVTVAEGRPVEASV